MIIQSPLLAISATPYIQRNPQDANKTALNELRATDARLRADAAANAAKAGIGATGSVTYRYVIGSDGKAYATGAVLDNEKRAQSTRDPQLSLKNKPSGRTQPDVSYQAVTDRLNNIITPRAQLSPADEAFIYGSNDYLNETRISNEAQARAKFQLYDAAVRAQEGQPFESAFGLSSSPDYDFEVGADGELYAANSQSNTPDKGFRASQSNTNNASDSAFRADTAATDISAQDTTPVHTPQSRATALYTQISYLVYQETPLFQLAA